MAQLEREIQAWKDSSNNDTGKSGASSTGTGEEGGSVVNRGLGGSGSVVFPRLLMSIHDEVLYEVHLSHVPAFQNMLKRVMQVSWGLWRRGLLGFSPIIRDSAYLHHVDYVNWSGHHNQGYGSGHCRGHVPSCVVMRWGYLPMRYSAEGYHTRGSGSMEIHRPPGYI